MTCEVAVMNKYGVALAADTVGSGIDVAILSRGDGFTWVKRSTAGREGGAVVLP